MSIFRFARRTPTTLADLARQYLNQALPDISGIFTLPQASNIITPVVEETVAAPGLTPEQLALLYPQNQGGGDDPVNTGFGLFNNLDENDVRYEVVNGELVPTYRNVSSGLYQTEKGKNVSNLGLSTPSFGFLEGIFGAKTPPEFPGYFQQDPNTRGSFIDYITGRTRRNKVEAFTWPQTVCFVYSFKHCSICATSIGDLIAGSGGFFGCSGVVPWVISFELGVKPTNGFPK